jgi:hypothetical protein
MQLILWLTVLVNVTLSITTVSAKSVCPTGDPGLTCDQQQTQEDRNESFQKGYNYGKEDGIKEGETREKFIQGVEKFIDSSGSLGSHRNDDE